MFKKLQERVVRFRDKRDWKQFHKPKDTALSLLLEAAELLELFQWKTEEETVKHLKTRKGKQGLSEELSDVLYWVLLMAHDYDIDLEDAFEKKMRKNEKKYPVKKAKGSAKKYTEL